MTYLIDRDVCSGSVRDH